MPKKHPVCFAILISIIFSHSPLTLAGENLYKTLNECNSASFTLGNNSTREIWVYLEDDFAQEMSSCTSTPNDDGNISEFHVRTIVESALEKWNQQSTGPVLHFGGTLNASLPSTACSMWGPYSPIIFIRFHSGCKDITGSCPTNNVLATASKYSSSCAETNGCPKTLQKAPRTSPGEITDEIF